MVFRDRIWARSWLEPLNGDFGKLLEMRALVSSDSLDPLSLMTDEEVLDVVAVLLTSGRLHVHLEPMREVLVTDRGRTRPKIVAFPLAQQKRGPVTVSRKPVEDPPTFPSDLDVSVQASVLVAAAARGIPLCPT